MDHERKKSLNRKIVIGKEAKKRRITSGKNPMGLAANARTCDCKLNIFYNSSITTMLTLGKLLWSVDVTFRNLNLFIAEDKPCCTSLLDMFL
jgi:hypothetical protein